MAVRCRHAIDARPDPPDDAAEALARQDAQRLHQRAREPALAVAACESVEGKVVLARDGTDGLAAQVAHAHLEVADGAARANLKLLGLQFGLQRQRHVEGGLPVDVPVK